MMLSIDLSQEILAIDVCKAIKSDPFTKQASKQCLFVNAGWYMGSYTADVDLRLGCSQSDILERIFWVLIYRY